MKELYQKKIRKTIQEFFGLNRLFEQSNQNVFGGCKSKHQNNSLNAECQKGNKMKEKIQ